MNTIPKMADQIIDLDVERDRKACVSLDLNATGANRELAQWLLDHIYYSSAVVANWLGCGQTRIKLLRKWAAKGFIGQPFDKNNKPDHRDPGHRSGRARDQEPLESLINSETPIGADGDEYENQDAEVADPATIEDNALYTLQRINENVRVFKKLFKASPFDCEARKRISTAIERTIQKLRSAQAILDKKGKDVGKA